MNNLCQKAYVISLITSLAVMPQTVAAKTLRVVTTTTDLSSIVQEVAGDLVNLNTIAKGQMNPHFVDAKPSYMVTLMKTDLFIQVGLDLEIGWAPLLIQGSRNRKIQVGARGFLDASAKIEPMEIPKNLTRAMGDVHPGGNPHYLLDPENAILVAKTISDKLIELDNKKEKAYRKKFEAFKVRVEEKSSAWKKSLAPHEGTKFIAYHRDWSYFARWSGLVVAGEIEPKPGIPPTGSHIAKLIRQMSSDNTRLIFLDPWYESRTPEYIARETNALVLPMALLPGSQKGTDDYFSWMAYNVRLVRESLLSP